MKTLLWKDYRQNRQLLIAVGIFSLTPYIITIWMVAIVLFRSEPPYPDLNEVTCASSSVALCLWVLISAFIAGNAIAGERADRSAEFAAYLPIPRRSSITSKAIVAIGSCFIIGFFNLVIFYVTRSEIGGDGQRQLLDGILITIPTTIFVFGVAWLFSSLLARPAIATVSGLASLVMISLAMLILSDMWAKEKCLVLYLSLCPILGVACFVAGVVCYLRRIEP